MSSASAESEPEGTKVGRNAKNGVILNKNEKIILPEMESPSTILIGCRWDLHQQSDLDMTLLLFDAKGRYLEAVSFMTPTSSDGSISHGGDDVMGLKTGDIETIRIKLDDCSERVHAMAVMISSFKGTLKIVKDMTAHVSEVRRVVGGPVNAGGERSVRQAAVNVVVDEEYWDHHKKMRRIDQNIIKHSAMCMFVIYRGMDEEAIANEDDTLELPPHLESKSWYVRGISAPGSGSTISQAIPFAQQELRCIIPSIKVFDKLPPLDQPEDVCQYLSPKMLSRIKKEFGGHDKHHVNMAGMTRTKFVTTLGRILMLAVTELRTPERAARLMALLHGFFEKIDLDFPHGIVNWGDFTNFCVDSGMRKTDEVSEGEAVGTRSDANDFRYERDNSYLNAVSRNSVAMRLNYVEGMGRMVLLEQGAPTLKILDDKGNVVGTMSADEEQKTMTIVHQHAPGGMASKHDKLMAQQEHAASLQHRKESSECAIFAIEYWKATVGDKDEFLMMATSDKRLTLFKLTRPAGSNGTKKTNKKWARVYDLSAPVAMTKLCWCRNEQVLASVGDDHTIYLWTTKKGRIVDRLSMHTALITDLVQLPRQGWLVSCSFDRKIGLWDVKRGRLVSTLVGHTKGIKALAFRDNVLVSAGFEYDAIAWDLTAKKKLMLLHGHHASLVGLQMVKSADADDGVMTGSGSGVVQCVTADVDGVFKMWAMHTSDSNGMAPCWQTWYAPYAMLGHLETFCMPPMRAGELAPKVIAAGSRLICFKAHKKEKPMVAPSLCCFSGVEKVVMGLVGSDVHFFDACSGQQIKVIPHLAERKDDNAIDDDNEKPDADADELAMSAPTLQKPHEVTAMVLAQPRQRKVIVGNVSGEIKVHAVVNGVCMRAGKPHDGQPVVAIISCPHTEMIISAGANKICVCQETEDDVTTLRFVKNAHERQITAISYSPRLSLIATGAKDNALRLWDFQSLTLLEVCNGGHDAEITAIAFADPYPLLISADLNATVLIWAIGGSAQQKTGVYEGGQLGCLLQLVPSVVGGGFIESEPNGYCTYWSNKASEEAASQRVAVKMARDNQAKTPTSKMDTKIQVKRGAARRAAGRRLVNSAGGVKKEKLKHIEKPPPSIIGLHVGFSTHEVEDCDLPISSGGHQKAKLSSFICCGLDYGAVCVWDMSHILAAVSDDVDGGDAPEAQDVQAFVPSDEEEAEELQGDAHAFFPEAREAEEGRVGEDEKEGAAEAVEGEAEGTVQVRKESVGSPKKLTAAEKEASEKTEALARRRRAARASLMCPVSDSAMDEDAFNPRLRYQHVMQKNGLGHAIHRSLPKNRKVAPRWCAPPQPAHEVLATVVTTDVAVTENAVMENGKEEKGKEEKGKEDAAAAVDGGASAAPPASRPATAGHKRSEASASDLLQKSPGHLPRLWAKTHFIAHYDQLARIEVILDPDLKEGRPHSLILTVGCDYALRVWSQRGRMLGQMFTIFPAPLPPSHHEWHRPYLKPPPEWNVPCANEIDVDGKVPGGVAHRVGAAMLLAKVNKELEDIPELRRKRLEMKIAKEQEVREAEVRALQEAKEIAADPTHHTRKPHAKEAHDSGGDTFSLTAVPDDGLVTHQKDYIDGRKGSSAKLVEDEEGGLVMAPEGKEAEAHDETREEAADRHKHFMMQHKKMPEGWARMSSEDRRMAEAEMEADEKRQRSMALVQIKQKKPRAVKEVLEDGDDEAALDEMVDQGSGDMEEAVNEEDMDYLKSGFGDSSMPVLENMHTAAQSALTKMRTGLMHARDIGMTSKDINGKLIYTHMYGEVYTGSKEAKMDRLLAPIDTLPSDFLATTPGFDFDEHGKLPNAQERFVMLRQKERAEQYGEALSELPKAMRSQALARQTKKHPARTTITSAKKTAESGTEQKGNGDDKEKNGGSKRVSSADARKVRADALAQLRGSKGATEKPDKWETVTSISSSEFEQDIYRTTKASRTPVPSVKQRLARKAELQLQRSMPSFAEIEADKKRAELEAARQKRMEDKRKDREMMRGRGGDDDKKKQNSAAEQARLREAERQRKQKLGLGLDSLIDSLEVSAVNSGVGGAGATAALKTDLIMQRAAAERDMQAEGRLPSLISTQKTVHRYLMALAKDAEEDEDADAEALVAMARAQERLRRSRMGALTMKGKGKQQRRRHKPKPKEHAKQAVDLAGQLGFLNKAQGRLKGQIDFHDEMRRAEAEAAITHITETIKFVFTEEHEGGFGFAFRHPSEGEDDAPTEETGRGGSRGESRGSKKGGTEKEAAKGTPAASASTDAVVEEPTGGMDQFGSEVGGLKAGRLHWVDPEGHALKLGIQVGDVVISMGEKQVIQGGSRTTGAMKSEAAFAASMLMHASAVEAADELMGEAEESRSEVPFTIVVERTTEKGRPTAKKDKFDAEWTTHYIATLKRTGLTEQDQREQEEAYGTGVMEHFFGTEKERQEALAEEAALMEEANGRKTTNTKGSAPKWTRGTIAGKIFYPMADDVDVLRYGKIFQEIDENKSGEVERDQFEQFIEMAGVGDRVDSRVFYQLDVDASGLINMEEVFTALYPSAPKGIWAEMALFCKEEFEKRRKMGRRRSDLSDAEVSELTNVFRLYDKDKSGSLTFDELKVAMAGLFEQKELLRMLEQSGLSSDREVNAEDFITFMAL
jgi:WD40 repeat protein/Ca2+-binding EF-hand superfamily protein